MLKQELLEALEHNTSVLKYLWQFKNAGTDSYALGTIISMLFSKSPEIKDAFMEAIDQFIGVYETELVKSVNKAATPWNEMTKFDKHTNVELMISPSYTVVAQWDPNGLWVNEAGDVVNESPLAWRPLV